MVDTDANISHPAINSEKVIEAMQQIITVAEYVRKGISNEPSSVATKADASPVTVADFCCQILLNEYLLSIENGCKFRIISEESSAILRQDTKLADRCCTVLNECTNRKFSPNKLFELVDFGEDVKSSSFWVIDPIDGTKGFLRHGHYAICLAYVENSEPVFGIMGCPNTDHGKIYWAQRGMGAFELNIATGEKTKLATKERLLSECILTESFESSHKKQQFTPQLIKNLNICIEPILADSQVKYAFVASGVANFYVRFLKCEGKEKIWDHAAGYLIVKEAGGITTDLSGKELYFAGENLEADKIIISSSNVYLHSAMLDSIRGVYY